MNIFEAYNSTKKELESAGIEDYVFESKQIIKHITGFTNAEILTNYTNKLTVFQSNNLTAIIKQRKLRYPLQYIFGEWSFYGRNFFVGPGVLIPRADTETLIDKSLEFLKGVKNPQILDLCAGSGCIGITLAKETVNSSVLMVEKYSEAMRYAEKNIVSNAADNAKVILGDVFSGDGKGEYDLIVSNPPYISESEMSLISPETKYEPETALKAEDNGLVFYKKIAKKYKNCLKKGGMIAFEVGFKQSDAVKEILENAGYTETDTVKDLNGIKRVVFGFYNNKTEEK